MQFENIQLNMKRKSSQKVYGLGCLAQEMYASNYMSKYIPRSFIIDGDEIDL